MKRHIVLVVIGVLGVVLVPSASAQTVAQTVGVVMDWNQVALFFDADADTVLGTVTIPGGAVGDCAITADGSLGYATNFLSELWVLDIPASALAAGTNPIPMTTRGEDVSITADGKYAVVCGGVGAPSNPLSVVDIAARAEINTFTVGQNCTSVDACADGSLLVTSSSVFDVRRLIIGAAGNVVDTGDALDIAGSEVNNVTCAPSAMSGIVVVRTPAQIRSFTIPGLAVVDTRGLSGGFGISVVINVAGSAVYVRSNDYIDAFTYNEVTGALGAVPLWTASIAGTQPFYGMDQMALHPNQTKLYVSQPGALNIYDPGTGGLLGSIPVSSNSLTGVCFRPGTPPTVPTSHNTWGNVKSIYAGEK